FGGLVGGLSGSRYLILLAILGSVAGLAYQRGYTNGGNVVRAAAAEQYAKDLDVLFAQQYAQFDEMKALQRGQADRVSALYARLAQRDTLFRSLTEEFNRYAATTAAVPCLNPDSLRRINAAAAGAAVAAEPAHAAD